MSAVMTAMFDEYAAADHARLDLLRDGFPTDRVDLTAGCELGRAALVPARTPHDMLVRHFQTLFREEDERPCIERLVDRIAHGGAAVTVHPRGPLETERALQILEGAHPLELARHDLARQRLEHAAAGHEQPWIRAFWLEGGHSSECIYCRLFEHH